MAARDGKKDALDFLFSMITGAAAFMIILFIIGILYVLIAESSPAIHRFGVLHFLASTDWDPVRNLLAH